MIVKFEKVGFKKIGLWGYLNGVVNKENRIWMEFVGNDKFTPDAIKSFVAGKYKEGDDIEVDAEQDDEGKYNIKKIIIGKDVGKTEKVETTKEEKKTTGLVKPKPPYVGKTQNYSDTTRNSIERQQGMIVTAQIIQGMDGVTEKNVQALMDKIFDKAIERIQNG